MKLPLPVIEYNRRQAGENNRIIEQADRENHKRGRDVEIGAARLILTSPNGTRYSIEVDDAGNLSASAV